jgi:hypothetical protein
VGLADTLMSGVSGSAEGVAMFSSIATSMEREQDAWIASLRAAGVKAAHPDDGWVDRTHNTVQFVYPQFNDGAKAGDLVALGWPRWGSEKPCHRIVRLIELERGAFSSSWRFEPASLVLDAAA